MDRPDSSASTSSPSSSFNSVRITRTLTHETALLAADDDSGLALEPPEPSIAARSLSSNSAGHEFWDALDKVAAVTQEVPLETGTAEDGISTCTCQGSTPGKSRKPFHKWVRSLHRRRAERQKILESDSGPVLRGQCVHARPPRPSNNPSHHRHSSSESSFGFVAAARSASVSLASASIIGRSRRPTIRSLKGHSRTDRSSKASVSGGRISEDGHVPERLFIMDPAVTERSLQRRRILEELINTEEAYIGDIRFLTNVYVTILASLPTLQAGLRSSINRNLTDIIELHDEVLGELHQAVPDSEYTQIDLAASPPKPDARRHHRWRSLDAVPEDKDGMSWLQHVPGMIAEPQVAADVAKIFAKKMNRFFIYEEYGAKYELMIKDLAVAHRSMPEWDKYQKGLEALASSLGSTNSRDDSAKKSLTIADLLVKPIQRVCKYPLLFAELLKHTPVCDCPYSYMEIESSLIRLREATSAINRATDDARIKATLEKTWLLQDRLVFPNQKLDAASKSRIRSFGHIQLCGVLHLCWQTKDGVRGSYMICLLYREWLCLASATKVDQIYTVQACLALSNVNVEDIDNGRGLQCHTAPFSWKIIFECDYELYELIMTACSPKEEVEWRRCLGYHSAKHLENRVDFPLFSSLSLNIKSLGTVFGRPGTVARRISIHRATTVGPKSPLCQVIVKNTSVEKDAVTSTSRASINRSQSLLATNGRIPVLAPSRGDRARLEALLSDVWTREVLPFPGITVRARSEHLVRSSASSVIRKLSVTSIASTFTRRSSSMASIHKIGASDEPVASACDTYQSLSSVTNQQSPSTETACDSDYTAKSRLSSISDEGEMKGITPVQSPMAKAADVSGTVRRLVPMKLERDWQLDIAGGDASLLKKSSTSKLGAVSRGMSIASQNSLRTSSRESIFQESCKASSIKSASRWTRVGVLHRGIMVQGLRSFFRP